jgi:pimeloyl-ACP methyl ester carboxylesterase
MCLCCIVQVILQFRTSFDPEGLLTADKKLRYADEKLLGAVKQPVLFMCGDRDRMCPPQGAKKTFEVRGAGRARV